MRQEAPGGGQQGGANGCGERRSDAAGSIGEVRAAASLGYGVTDAQNGPRAGDAVGGVDAAAGVETQSTRQVER